MVTVALNGAGMKMKSSSNGLGASSHLNPSSTSSSSSSSSSSAMSYFAAAAAGYGAANHYAAAAFGAAAATGDSFISQQVLAIVHTCTRDDPPAVVY